MSLVISSVTYASFPVTEPIEESPITEIVEPVVSSDSGWPGIVSLSCAVLGLVIAGLPLGICAIVFGALGLSRELKGMAIAGLVLGIIDVIVILAYIL